MIPNQIESNNWQDTYDNPNQCPNFKKLLICINKTRRYYIRQGYSNEQIEKIIFEKIIPKDFQDQNQNLYNKLTYTTEYYILKNQFQLDHDNIEQTMQLKKELSKINQLSEISDLLKYRINGHNSKSPSSNSDEFSNEHDGIQMNQLIHNEMFNGWNNQIKPEQAVVQTNKRRVPYYIDEQAESVEVTSKKIKLDTISISNKQKKRRFPSQYMIEQKQEKKLKLYQCFNPPNQ